MTKINQPQGPRTGNTGSPSKRSAFTAAKESYRAAAEMITRAIGARAGQPNVPKTNHERNQGQISPNTNRGRGPTRGNK